MSNKGWRGKQSGPGETTHKWQARAAGPRKSAAGRRSWQSHWLIYTALGTILLGTFLYLVLFSPAKTPVILALGVKYEAPIPPNQWVQEDGERLEDNGRLIVTQVKGSWTGVNPEGRKSFHELLEQHKKLYRGFRPIREPLVIYFNMPGVVNDHGEPCLLPPGASALVSDDWIKVSEIVEAIKAVPGERKKLLILDSNHEVINWDLGIVYNTFMERMKEYLSTAELPDNLAVMTSADVGQKSWKSPKLRGSAFSHFLQLGLMGLADIEGPDPDGKVSLNELAAYLKESVGDWARTNRGALQEPTLITKKGQADFVLTYAYRQRAIDRFRAEDEDAKVSPTVGVQQLASLWEQHDKLQGYGVLRYDPLGVSSLERRLLRLEQLAYGGMAYAKEADDLANKLSEELAGALERAKGKIESLPDYLAILNRGGADKVRLEVDESSESHKLNCLPLRVFFDQTNSQSSYDQVRGFQDALIRVVKGTDPVTAQLDEKLMGDAYVLPETQLLLAARQQNVHRGGDRINYLENLMRLRKRADLLAVPFLAVGASNNQEDSPSPKDGLWRPGDERAHYYVRRMLRDAENQRRAAEDTLFSTSLSSQDRQKKLDDAERLYDRAEETRDDAIFAFEVLDRAYREIPYLANWVCQLHLRGKTDKAPGSVTDVIDLIRDTHALGEALNNLERIETRPEEIAVVVSAANSLSGTLENKYLDSYEDAANNLAGASNETGEELADLEALLSTPLLKHDLRAKLLAKLGEEPGRTNNVPSTETEESQAKKKKLPAEIATQVASWELSPLLAILDSSGDATSSETNVTRKLEQLNDSARTKLFELRDLDVNETSVDEAGGNAHWKDRMAWSRAERKVRAAAAFGFEPPRVDPIARLRYIDLQQLLIWHARRTLDDFWHAVAGSYPTSLNDLLAAYSGRTDTLFAESASNLLAAAGKLNDNTPNSVRFQLDEVEKLLKERLAASRKGMDVSGTTFPITGGSGNEVEVKLEIGFTPEGKNLPEGLGAIYLTDTNRQLVEAAFSSDGDYLSTKSERPVPRSARARIATGRSLEAAVFFRGRRFQKDVEVRTLGGSVVEYVPPQAERQSVTLLGDQAARPATVFILDCSASMEELIPAEGGGEKSRMDVAKTALGAMLGGLSAQSSIRTKIGVFFYGHRLGWDMAHFRATKEYKVIENKGEQVRQGLPPGSDVERILPLTVFNSTENGKVSKRLQKVKRWGVTPVYLAIRDALKEFGPNNLRDSNSIVVITDGFNNQEHHESSRYQNPEQVSLEQVLELWAQKRESGLEIPIHIVGFAISEKEKQQYFEKYKKDPVKEFETLANTTGGKYVPAETEGQLVDYLKERKDLNGYVVRTSDGRALTRNSNTRKEEPVFLNSKVDIPKDVGLPAVVEVQYQDFEPKQVVFEGGEALVMNVDDNNQIVGVPYTDNAIKNAKLNEGDSGGASEFVLRVHRPKKSGSEVQFRLSVQDERSHFTPRPKEVWVEVTPDGTSQTYRFYDRVFEMQTPVPVVSFKASNWPQDSKSATIRFWCAYEETNTPLVQRLADMSDLESENPAPQDVEGVGVKTMLQNEGANELKLVVEEWHDDKSSLGAIRVKTMQEGPGILLSKVSHRFDENNLLVQHQYTFLTSGLSKQEFKEHVSVSFASAAAFKRSALQLADPMGLHVPIVEQGSTLEPTISGAASF